MGMGTGGIPTNDNIPETTEKLGCPINNIPVTTEIFGFPTDNIPETTEKLGCPTDNIPETTDFLKHLILSYSFEMTNARFIYLKFLGYIVSCGYPTRTHTRGNSVAHV
jgi:hypothetical protein